MKKPALGLGVDLSHPLGQKVFAFLTRAHVPHVYERRAGLPYARVLLVRSSTEHAFEAQVIRLEALSSSSSVQPHVADSSGRLMRLAYVPSMDALMPRLRIALETGRFVTAASERALAYISEDDIALAAAASLASEELLPGFHVVHGPGALSHRQIVSLVGALFERPISLETVALSQLQDAWRSLGLNTVEARAAQEADFALLQESPFSLGHTFSVLTGLTPLTFPRFLEQRHASLSELPLRPATAQVRVDAVGTIEPDLLRASA